jgi:predicted CXXCH cytochrome family protein
MRLSRFAIAFLTVTSIASASPEAVTYGDSNEWCLRCHGMETLGVRQHNGIIRSLSVDSVALGHSNHRQLDCVDCHTEDARRFPHGETPEAATCTDCHTRSDHPLNSTDPLASIRFSDIETEFNQSIHRRKLGEVFTCFSCHNPHQFRTSEDPSLQSIDSQNNVCLECHDNSERFVSLTQRDRPNLDNAHAWLPNRATHWEHVRCLDCHTSYEPPNLSHLILTAKSAIRECESCHTQNSVLLDKLYRYRVAEERQETGFLNAAILNNSYVIGATRHRWLDLIGIVVIGVTLAGTIGHGLARRFGRRRRDRR